MTNHSLVVAAMLVATLSTATSYLLEYPTIPEPCGSSYSDRQTIAILRVCVVTIIKTLEQLSSCFVSNLYDNHNHLRVSPTWTNGPSGGRHRWQGKETPEDSVRVEYSGARVRWCWSSRTEDHGADTQLSISNAQTRRAKE